MSSVVLAATCTLTAWPGRIDATCAALVSGYESCEDLRELHQAAAIRGAINAGTLDTHDPLTFPPVRLVSAAHRPSLNTGIFDKYTLQVVKDLAALALTNEAGFICWGVCVAHANHSSRSVTFVKPSQR